MNKILIALVLAVVMSGNAYADESIKGSELYLICNNFEDENLNIELHDKVVTFEINKVTKIAKQFSLKGTGNFVKVDYELEIKDFFIEMWRRNIGNNYDTREHLYNIDRKTLKISKSLDLSLRQNRLNMVLELPLNTLKSCNVSTKEVTEQFRNIMSVTRKLNYDKDIKF